MLLNQLDIQNKYKLSKRISRIESIFHPIYITSLIFDEKGLEKKKEFVQEYCTTIFVII